jgi:hypothetical protein
MYSYADTNGVSCMCETEGWKVKIRVHSRASKVQGVTKKNLEGQWTDTANKTDEVYHHINQKQKLTNTIHDVI